MTQTLHEVDEETDVGAYQAYLRAQTDTDLFDIVQHLNPDRYPARLDAAQREFRRRHVLHVSVYTANEYAIRYAALFAFGMTAVTLALTLLLTPEDAAEPPWPLGIPDGMVALRVARMFLTALLRGTVLWSVHLGLYDVLWATLGYWIISRGTHLLRRRARADVWRLVLAAWAALTGAMLLAAGPASSVPDLFSGDVARALTLFNPFG